MDYKTFKTRKEAKAAAAKMRGWTTKVTELCLPNDSNASKAGGVWVIKCDEKYLRADGYIR